MQAPLTYQWQSSTDNVSFSSIPGATISTFTTPPLSINTYYRVIIKQSASGCETISDSALVYVVTIATQPQTPAPICIGGVASMSISASLNGGAGTLTYQWQSSLNGTVWSDVTAGAGFDTPNLQRLLNTNHSI